MPEGMNAHKTLDSLDNHCNDVEHAGNLLLYLSHSGSMVDPQCLHLLADTLALIGKKMRSDIERLGAMEAKT
jgi:hypothetical protein